MIGPREAVIEILKGSGTGPSTTGLAQGGARITWETVTAVSRTGLHTVLGVELPVTGLMIFPVGARVPVAWRGSSPVVIIGHRARRAQFHPSYRRTAQGIVEELFIADLDGNGKDAWYRNHAKSENLGITQYLDGQTPTAVKWGMDGRSFAVTCTGGYYATFSLSREDANVVSDDAPGAAILLWLGRLQDISISMVTPSYGKTITKKVIEWVGKLDRSTGYTAYESREGMWYWNSHTVLSEQGWEGSAENNGSVATSTAKPFDLAGLLAGTIRDWHGNALASAELLDWYLDTDRQIKLLYRVDWDYFVIGDNKSASGTVAWPHGLGSENLSVTGASMGVIGAKRASDRDTVPESHLFLVVPQSASVEWATCASAPAFAWEQSQLSTMLIEHQLTEFPSYPAGLPQPHGADWDPPYPQGSGGRTEWYGVTGVTGGNLPWVPFALDAGVVGEERGKATSSTGTGQMFDPARLQALASPYSVDSGGTSGATRSMLGGWTAAYSVNFSTITDAVQQLWHYRVESAQILTRRIAVTVAGATVYRDEPLFFVTLERYAYSGGYINDLPMVWVGIVGTNGATVQVLRDWQYGLNASATRLVSGNGHRIIWTLGTGALQTTITYRLTLLPSGAETTFTSEQVLALMAARAALYTPDFLWGRSAPEAFDLPVDLSGLTTDVTLADLAVLEAVVGAPSGDVRMVNDAEILTPLGRYLAT
jgi:hypothetical protein